jgi:hypothetical protein
MSAEDQDLPSAASTCFALSPYLGSRDSAVRGKAAVS